MPFGSGEISRCASPRRGAGPAQVAIRSACSMRKSACGTRSQVNHEGAWARTPSSQRFEVLWIDLERFEYELEVTAIDRFDRNTLQLGTFARFQRDVAPGSAEGLCDDLDQLGVRRAVDGRRLKSNKQSAIPDSRNARLARSRNDADGESDHVRVPKMAVPMRTSVDPS